MRGALLALALALAACTSSLHTVATTDTAQAVVADKTTEAHEERAAVVEQTRGPVEIVETTTETRPDGAKVVTVRRTSSAPVVTVAHSEATAAQTVAAQTTTTETSHTSLTTEKHSAPAMGFQLWLSGLAVLLVAIAALLWKAKKWIP